MPIYIILSFEYAVLTLRFWRMLDKVRSHSRQYIKY